MAEDRKPDPADQPEDDKTPPQDNPPEPYRLGGSGGSGKSPSGRSGEEPDWKQQFRGHQPGGLFWLRIERLGLAGQWLGRGRAWAVGLFCDHWHTHVADSGS